MSTYEICGTPCSIRAAKTEEYDSVRNFYYELIDSMRDAQYRPGWEKDVYPAPEFLQKSIEKGELFLGEIDGQIAACMVVNHEYNDGYKAVRWTIEAADSELLVIHWRLTCSNIFSELKNICPSIKYFKTVSLHTHKKQAMLRKKGLLVRHPDGRKKWQARRKRILTPCCMTARICRSIRRSRMKKASKNMAATECISHRPSTMTG